MTAAITAEALGKRYRIGLREQRPDTLARALIEGLRRPLTNLSRLRSLSRVDANGEREDLIWALRETSFEVAEGEVLGIIGPNGAGKSTLLKILARITDPTVGRAVIRGRVASLLEVGTGFHPELTGRENVYLNGTILGMKKAEIDRKFDEIVAFSGVEKFLDTPIKRYSSGMKVRLAFAVAAHLDPEILLIDEVLAVGDAEFQRRCLGKMKSVADAGRTILFVSHQMSAVRVLCDRAILLSGGTVAVDGPAREVVAAYESTVAEAAVEPELADAEGIGDERVRLRSLRLLRDGEVAAAVPRSAGIEVEITFEVRTDALRLNPHVHLHNSLGELLFISTNWHDPGHGNRRYGPGTYRARCSIPGNLLNAGRHSISAYLISDNRHQHVALPSAASFEVLDDGSDRGDYAGGWQGAVRPLLVWEVDRR